MTRCPHCGAATTAGELLAAAAIVAVRGPAATRDRIADALTADAHAKHEREAHAPDATRGDDAPEMPDP